MDLESGRVAILKGNMKDEDFIIRMFIKTKSKKLLEKKKNNFLIDLANIAMVAEDTKSTKYKPQTFNEAW